MKCDKARDALQLRLDGMLLAQEDAELQSHLAHCPSCRNEDEKLKNLAEAFSTLPPVQLTHSIVDQLIPQLEDEGQHIEKTSQQKPSFFVRQKKWWISGGVAAMFLFSFFFWQGEGGAPENASIEESQSDISMFQENGGQSEDDPAVSGFSDEEKKENNGGEESKGTATQEEVQIIYSPDRQYRAVVGARALQVLTEEGDVYFQSSKWGINQQAKVNWETTAELTIQIYPRVDDISQMQPIETRVVNIEEKTEKVE
ncbi:zf-HC2 domain-containing protein [Mechercharimyces sp. CAU 1602]|uniref:zf-HC2 domain-containing protein n=1 Tax=Mechercharimyces sp. CAU 1602 TaxID=2973933 RepID=UPI002161AE3B|nr:zf-HC2 domain-containing protein [Mechercharimyces sp. CAU 1602]MCS1350432.1 zf-HC2 domain-containing protein [Mechercharimyces sp. CAU 1602]